MYSDDVDRQGHFPEERARSVGADKRSMAWRMERCLGNKPLENSLRRSGEAGRYASHAM
jgi:hypothetical protein